MIAPLAGSPELPAELRDAYAGWSWRVAYQYGPPMLTYRLTSPTNDVHYLKLARNGLFPGLEDEAARMRWSIDHLPVPVVVQQATRRDVTWLITRSLPGVNAMDSALRAEPERLVRTLAGGLRRFHEAPIERCPFDFRLDTALDHARRRFDSRRFDVEEDLHPEFAHIAATDAIEQLERTRPLSEDPVVCHGDYCFPNILVENDTVTGYVDLGELGVADRWWDLAVATWSVTWNLGPGFEDAFLDAYEIARDDERQTFYRLLYDVVS
jgi:kanamycin kinase